MSFRLGVGVLSLIAGLIVAGFALNNAYKADAATAGEILCGHEVMDDVDQVCVTRRPGQALPPPGLPAGATYDEMRKSEEDTAVSKAWIFGVEILGVFGVFLVVCGLVFVSASVWRPRGPSLPVLFGGVLVLSTGYALALWPAQDDARSASPAPPGIFGFVGFSYLPMIVVLAAAIFTLMADKWKDELDPVEPEDY